MKPLSLFRKRYTPEQLGAMIYEELRRGMASQGILSVSTFLQSLDRGEPELDNQYLGEIMVGAMFGAVLSIQRSSSGWVADQIENGMKQEFFSHLREQGATPVQVAEWEAVLDVRFEDYRACLQGYEGFEPPWKLGRQFFWNLVGSQEYIAMSIKISTLYMLEARDATQPLLNEHGPSLVTTTLS